MAEALQQDQALPEATHQDMANAIRALAMDAVEKAEFRPSRHAHGHGRRGHGAVHALPEIRRRPSRLARPRPLRALRRPRLHAALRAPLSDRRAGHGHRPAQSLPSARLAHPGPSRIWPRAGHRDDHRPAWARGSATPSAWRSPSGSSTPAMATRSSSHFTYALAGDGCLMEGISHEAISLAGHLKLGRLIVLFDDNQISIDGPTSLAVSDDQLERFAASHWHVARVDGHDPEAVALAIENARAVTDRPSLIACRTIIGYGAPKKAGHGVHPRLAARRRGDRGRTRASCAGVTRPSRCRSRSWRAGAPPARSHHGTYEAWERAASRLDAEARAASHPTRSTPPCAPRSPRPSTR